MFYGSFMALYRLVNVWAALLAGLLYIHADLFRGCGVASSRGWGLFETGQAKFYKTINYDQYIHKQISSTLGISYTLSV